MSTVTGAADPPEGPPEAPADRTGGPPEAPADPQEGPLVAPAEPSAGGAGGSPGLLVERRLHPLTPLRRAWAPVALVVGWAMHDPNGTYERLSGLATSTLLLVVGVFVPAACLYGFLTWWMTHFAVTGSELRIRTGLLFRRTAHIRLDRLQAVDVTRPLLARMAGVAKLKLDVVGTKSKDELAYLGEADARALRAELLARAAGFAPDTARRVGEAEVREILRVRPRTLAWSVLLSGATGGTLLAAVVVPTLLWLASHSVWSILVTAVPLVGGAGARTVRRFVNEFDWTVGESPDGLRLDHGLLDRVHETVPPGRVQTLRIVEPVLWRRAGWVRVELHVAGSANSVLVPVAPRDEAEAVIGRVLPGVAVPGTLSRPPGRARWMLPLWWRGQGVAVGEEVFVARYGLVRRVTSLVPHAKVQSVRWSQGPWERVLRLAGLALDTGANKTVTVRARDVREAEALFHAQAERSRTGRRLARPDQWMKPRDGDPAP